MSEKNERIEYLVELLNKCCDEYYNGSNPTLSDSEYDALFDELTNLENETGIVHSNSPTQRAGYEVLSELEKVEHNIPLLSLAKTKSVKEVFNMLIKGCGYLGLKMDGLTVELKYENGKLIQASTRGDGNIGEIITHNAQQFVNIPKVINDYKNITVTGEAYIDVVTFESINNEIDNDEDKYSTPRNLAAGSVRQLDSRTCALRRVKFMPFSVLEGMENIDSKFERLNILQKMGFDRLPSVFLNETDTEENVSKEILKLKEYAETNSLPIDGIVFTYNSAEFSKSLGRTSHHFKDGIAYKFGDPHFNTVLKNIDWNISRTGQLTPIAEFNPVLIDNTVVEKASLHNMTFIENLKLNIGDTIKVSKRNMIIPHVEENISGSQRENYVLDYPHNCPICGSPTYVSVTEASNKDVKVLYCSNESCPGKNIKAFTHFVSKQALNIDGLSESTLKKFIKKGWCTSLIDIFNLSNHKEEIAKLEGFGEKSAENICNAIENAKNTTLTNLLVALNIGLVGKSAALSIEEKFSGNAQYLFSAITDGFDFTQIDGFGEAINTEIHNWFNVNENRLLYQNLLNILNIKQFEKIEIDTDNMFYGKTVVITGTFEKYSRDELTQILQNSGAKATTSVSKKTDIVLCGENAGSKLQKAKDLGVRIIYENELNL